MAEQNGSTPEEQEAPVSADNGRATAVISDVHGNLEALEAVLADIQTRGIERIISLGDTLGYGPNPCECLDMIIEKCEWSLMGNHDFAVLYEPTSFNASAEAASFWTRQQLENEPDPAVRQRRWVFLGGLEIRKNVGDSLGVS